MKTVMWSTAESLSDMNVEEGGAGAQIARAKTPEATLNPSLMIFPSLSPNPKLSMTLPTFAPESWVRSVTAHPWANSPFERDFSKVSSIASASNFAEDHDLGRMKSGEMV